MVENTQKQLCRYFLKGLCKKGDNCDFPHQEKSKPKFSGKKSQKICNFFLQANCKNEDCHFSHSISNELKFIQCIQLTEECPTYIVYAKNLFFVALEQSLLIYNTTGTLAQTLPFEGKVISMKYLNEKLFVTILVGDINKIFIFSDQGQSIIPLNFGNVTDISEMVTPIIIHNTIYNLLFISSKNFVEIHAILNAESKSNLRINSNDKTYINSLVFYEPKKLIFAGYQSGFLATWEMQIDNTFTIKSLDKICDHVSKLCLFQQNFLICCSTDKSIKIFNLENFSVILSQKLDYSLKDLSILENHEKEAIFAFTTNNNELYFCKEIQGKIEKYFFIQNVETEGELKKRSFFEIRDNSGHYLVLTFNGKLIVNQWVKPLVEIKEDTAMKNLNKNEKKPKKNKN